MNDTGFTLLEVLISLILFSLVTAAMSPSFISHLRFNTRSELRTEAYAAAQQVLDELRAKDPSSFPSSGNDPILDVPIGQRHYQVLVRYCLTTTLCPSNNTRHLTVTVSYKGITQYEVETVYTKLN